MEAVQDTTFAPPGLGAIRPDYAMTCAQFGALVIPVAVYPVMEGGRICLSPADERAEEALERVRSSLELLAPPATPDRAGWAVLKVRDLLERVNAVPQFKDDDIWCGALGDQPILVVKQAVLDVKQMSLDQAVRRVHRGLVATALQKGLPVPGEVVREHQLDLDQGAERELS